MPDTPWKLQRVKRRTPSTTPVARKRVRISDDVDARSRSALRSRSQKTLTQIAFIQSPQTSFEEDTDLQEIVQRSNKENDIPKPRPRKLQKRESTLTQMPWLSNDAQAASENLDGDMLPHILQTGMSPPKAPRLDGAHNSPRQQTRREMSVNQEPVVHDLSIEDREGNQQSRPRKKRKQADNKHSKLRRRSSRIASNNKMLEDEPDDNYLPFNHGMYTDVESKPEDAVPNRPPVLEIQDSTDVNDEETPRPNWPRRWNCPQTPKREYIASSQTPESGARSTARKFRNVVTSPSKSIIRMPLGERSTNILLSPRREKSKIASPIKSTVKRSPPRKVCVLKVPSRALLPRKSHVDDSQRDVYSFQPTSTPQSGKESLPSLEPLPVRDPAVGAVGQPSSDETNINDNGDFQSSPPVESGQDSLPQLSDLIPHRKSSEQGIAKQMDVQGGHHQAAAPDEIAILDFGLSGPITTVQDIEMTNPNVVVDDEMLLDNAQDEVLNSDTHEQDELDSDFGSPIPNDTQFNADLQQRTSSPIPGNDPSLSGKRKQSSSTTKPATPSRRSTQGITKSQTFNKNDDFQAGAPLPPPRLVHQSLSTGKEVEEDNDNVVAEEPTLPGTSHYYSSHLPVIRMPLNDIMTTSSSPLSSTPKGITQKSIHPASIPRPSQMSTQDPTQHYLQSSMFPYAPNIEEEGAVERITIKDSSSQFKRLSQIPEGDHPSQSQGLDVRLVEDTDNEIDDLDLDTEFRNRLSARKPLLHQTTRTESSLRSIHNSSTTSSEQGNLRSSSPMLQAQGVRSIGQTITRSKLSAPASNDSRRDVNEEVLDLLDDIPTSSPSPPPLKRKYSPIPGFDNDTQSNFTQNGHVTAAYIHRQREAGVYPDWFVPQPYQAKGGKGIKSSKKKNQTTTN